MPALDPLAYWQEALRRDPGDTRVNTALGINYFKKARFAEAEGLFRKALERLTDKYTTPKDAEATYYLGLTLKAQGKFDEAYETLYKATWNMAWRAPAYFEAAEIASMRGDCTTALDLVERSLQANALSARSYTLKAAMLRHLGRGKEALPLLAEARRLTDPLDAGLVAEQWLAGGNAEDAQWLAKNFDTFPALAEETAAQYLHAGLWADGTEVLERMSKPSPIAAYYLAYFAAKQGKAPQASALYAAAAKLPPDYVFPFQYEVIPVLREAMKANPRDPRAPYYLGNLLYDWQPDEALRMWERAAPLDPSFAIVQRNLAVAYAHMPDGQAKAIASLEKAVGQQHKYALHFAELDELYEAAAAAPEKRLALLEANHGIVTRRDDSLAREISLKVTMGKYDEAIALMTGRRFAVWEGANLNVAEDWVNAHLLRGRQHLASRRFREALADFEAAAVIPENLPGEGRGAGGHEAEVAWWRGAAYEGLGDAEQARQCWTRASAATGGGFRPAGADAYYRALALGKLGQAGAMKSALEAMIQPAAPGRQLGPAGSAAARARLVQAHYAAGLGHLGLGEIEQARQELNQALALNPAHVGVRSALADMAASAR